MYNVTLKLKKPMKAAMIGLFSLEAYTFAVPSLLALPQFISESGGSNFTHALIVTALITWFTTDPKDGGEAEQLQSEETKPQAESGFHDTRKIASPLSGKVIRLLWSMMLPSRKR